MGGVYCSAPWNGITVREDGQVKTCCNGETTLIDLKHQSISDLKSSIAIRDIRQKMSNNFVDEKNCQLCIEEEKINGSGSLRKHYQTYYPEIDPTDTNLKFLDIRWNNTCNLGCLYCGETFSSTWVERSKNKNKKISPVRPYQDELLEWILDKADQINEIMLVGGEPMLMKQNYQLFDRLPKNCRISIITNLSYDFENLPCLENLLSRPKECINWNISAENTGDKIEYVRSGISWDRFRSNLEILNRYWPNQSSMNMVYNLFSAFDIDKTIPEFMDLGVQKFVFQGLHKNRILQVGHLPFELRRIAADRLKSAISYHLQLIHPEDRDLFYIHSAHNILSKLEQPGDVDVLTWKEFEQEIKWYDQWGKKTFEELWPDLMDMLKTHLE